MTSSLECSFGARMAGYSLQSTGKRVSMKSFRHCVKYFARHCSYATLGDKVPVSEKADKRRFSGPDSVRDVLSDMITIVEEENLEQYNSTNFLCIDEYEELSFPSSLQPG
ncbi:hypothetical protein SUGI_0800820 [Cryptomeria japonica]|nr:hypothetical protein SUGI_0800820 [Cryptomeria japonica]